ncbi:unnamed protein product [Chironomus riparius]|uniref:Secreted protein n=1 Tax=Chironomus riparius TaxID=315576 RepID=A0A9N9RJ40_9DIPT|nr:unnamed protein product [Chironomus riparius]
MKFLLLLTLFSNVLIIAFGGSRSTCEPLYSNFLALLQACELSSGRIANRTIGLATPFSEDIASKPNALLNILASGTSQLSGIDNSSILNALIGTADLPLPPPLDCIDTELIAFYPFVNNLFMNASSALAVNGRNSTINDDDTCNIVISYITPYYQDLNRIIHRILFDIFADIASFKLIEKDDLYLEQFSLNETSVLQLLMNGIASLFNADATLLTQFLTDPFADLPSNFFCRQDLLMSSISQAKLGYKLYSSRLTVPSDCDPFHDNFIAFVNAWINLVNDIQNFALDGTLNDPVLTPSYALYVQCASTQALILAANVTSRLSGVSSDTINGILRKTINLPFIEPLNCVADDLIYMSERLAYMSSEFTSVLNRFRERKSGSSRDFEALNMSDLFTSYITAINNCLLNMLGTEIAAILNFDPAVFIPIFLNSTIPLENPFSCVQTIILYMKDLLVQAQSSFLDRSPLNLTILPLPSYAE